MIKNLKILNVSLQKYKKESENSYVYPNFFMESPSKRSGFRVKHIKS